jgi:hypothetical protein
VCLCVLQEHCDAWTLTGSVLEEGKRMDAARGPDVLTDLRLDLPIAGPSGRCEAEIAYSSYLCGS